jgi:flavin reductase (DIM6/NTAB) family NADH-FMN oxidoreductase RutF/rubredoxin
MNIAALYKLSYGVYIIASKKREKLNGQIANTVFQVTAEPPKVAVSINKNNLTHEFISNSKVFTVSVLSKETPMKFISLFGFRSGRDINKFENIKYKLGISGAPIVLDNTISYLEIKVTNEIDLGSHTLFIGEAIDADIIHEGEPMTYAYYHEIKRGKAPKTAPTYIEEGIKSPPSKLSKYKCKICGYVYNPEIGDPASNIKPGTPFEELPNDWRCPICGAPKSEFEKID